MRADGLKIIKGLFWAAAERGSAQIINLLVTFVLARLLTPEDFGVIAIVSILIQLLDSFVISGLGNALIQKETTDERDYSSVFFFSLGVSFVLYAALIAGSSFISEFYQIEILAPILIAMGLRLPIAAFNSVQYAFIAKRMEFNLLFKASVAGALISACLGVVLALCGYGVWALVVQNISYTAINTFSLYLLSSWHPVFTFSFLRLKVLLAFGWKLMASSLLSNLYANLRDLIIGKLYAATALAYYNMGQRIPRLITVNVDTSLQKVLFPAFAERQNDSLARKRLQRTSIALGSFVLSPLLIGLAFTANNIVMVFLSDQWLSCVPFLIIMCFAYLMQPIQTSCIQVINAIGRSDISLKLEILKKVLAVLILVFSVVFLDGAIYVALAALLAEIVGIIVHIPVNAKLLEYSIREQMKDFLPPIILSVLMGIVIYQLNLLPLSNGLILVLQVIIGAFVYLVLAAVFHINGYDLIRRFLKGKIKSKH